MCWWFLLYWRQNLVLPSFTSKTFLIYSPNLVMDSICCLCLAVLQRRLHLSSVYLSRTILLFYVTTTFPLLPPVWQACHYYGHSSYASYKLIYLFICGCLEWGIGIDQKKTSRGGVWVPLVSLVSLWEGLVWWIAVFISGFIWLVLGLILKELI